jgi:hypothetical protein
MNELQKAGLALQGLSAGLGGRGPEFQESLARQNADQQALQGERQQAFTTADLDRIKTQFTDSQAGLRFAKEGRFDLVVQLGKSRLESAKNFPGVDFSDTEKFVAQAMAAANGDQNAASGLIGVFENNVKIGKSIGALDPDPGPELIKGGDIDDQGQVAYQNPDGTITMRQADGFKSKVENESNRSSPMTRIYDNGTNIQVRKSGESIVRGPDGNIVEGAERRLVLQTARQEQVNQKVAIAGETEAAKSSIAASDKYFDRLDAIRPLISNIDRAIAAIDDGAQSGVFMSMMPSFRDASKQLDNVQKRLGLDVVSNTTFGALSAGELSLAIDTALPTNMDPPELREWLVEKKNAQVKLSNYVEDAAIFLGTPGNTIPRWIEHQKSQRQVGGNQSATGKVKFLGFE